VREGDRVKRGEKTRKTGRSGGIRIDKVIKKSQLSYYEKKKIFSGQMKWMKGPRKRKRDGGTEARAKKEWVLIYLIFIPRGKKDDAVAQAFYSCHGTLGREWYL